MADRAEVTMQRCYFVDLGSALAVIAFPHPEFVHPGNPGPEPARVSFDPSGAILAEIDRGSPGASASHRMGRSAERLSSCSSGARHGERYVLTPIHPGGRRSIISPGPRCCFRTLLGVVFGASGGASARACRWMADANVHDRPFQGAERRRLRREVFHDGTLTPQKSVRPGRRKVDS